MSWYWITVSSRLSTMNSNEKKWGNYLISVMSDPCEVYSEAETQEENNPTIQLSNYRVSNTITVWNNSQLNDLIMIF